MGDWQIAVLHTERNTLLKRAMEAAFPGRIASIHVPALSAYRRMANEGVGPAELMRYFRRHVHDSGIWSNRVLTIYGDGELHHYTYALSRLAAERRGYHQKELPFSYFHFDNHRDDWGKRDKEGLTDLLDCANFVDTLCYDHGAVPFMIGPQAYPYKDVRGYRMGNQEIPIYSNYFTKPIQRSKDWKGIGLWSGGCKGTELPLRRDLRETPTPTYLSFDLDVLAHSEIVTNFDQNEHMTLRRLCQILDRVRQEKKVFGADILGFPDGQHHALSALTVVILARKVMGLGVRQLLQYHTYAKKIQALCTKNTCSAEKHVDYEEIERPSPISEGELVEVLKWTAG